MRMEARALLGAGSLISLVLVSPADAALVGSAASDRDRGETAAPVAVPAQVDAQTDDRGRATSANSAGQANDRQSLTSSDIIVTGSRSAESAPLTASLTTTQPQSAVSRDFIDHTVATADFNQLALLAPSVSLTGTGNGPGLSETKAQIRGFQDGEYNVTYDSIPFADTNNPTHHSTSFFPSNTIETMVVDRGPGNASQLGQATYGGNINLYSRGVTDEMGGQVEALSGIWNTFVARAELQSGAIDRLGGTRIVLTGQYLESDGALSFSPVGSKNLYGKAVVPLGTSNTFTVMSTWNRNFYYQSDVLKGATCGSARRGVPGFANAALGSDGRPLAQLTAENCSATSNVAAYGYDYGLSDDPTQQDYWRYNRTDKTTDFSYLRLQSDLAPGVSLDNRAYMYGYTNNTLSGNAGSVVTGFGGAGTAASPFKAITSATDVLGYDKLNKYRVFGYIGQLNYDLSIGRMRLGGWYERAVTDRHLFDLDRTTGAPSYSEKFNNGSGTAAQAALPSAWVANVGYLQHSTWSQYQIFGEFEIRPMENLAVTPGVKYVHFTRGVDAAVNQKSRSPLDASATWTKTLPFLTVNWQTMPNWAFYGQYAQGMYVPDLSSFYSTSGSLSATLDALKPQTTTNYQVGTVWHGRRVSLDLDGYVINVDNKIGTCTAAGCDTSLLVNLGKVRYKGVEGQLSVEPVRGITLFGNASYNYARSVSTGAQIAKAPFSTAAAGIVFDRDGLHVLFSQKYVGPQYATELSSVANGAIAILAVPGGERLYRIRPYSIGDFSISQDVARRLRLGVTVINVFNSRAVTSIANSGAGAPTAVASGATYQTGYGQGDQFSFLPPRSFLVDARLRFR